MDYQRCTRCVMDNRYDNSITFNKNGECNYCCNALERAKSTYFPNKNGQILLDKMLKEIKTYGMNKKYDCIMGISGGLDSSYLAYLGYKWGLRVLAVHIDDGFDTKISTDNIHKLVEKTGFDYVVIKPDAEQFYALTKAYMKAGVANIAIPQDNILFAAIYKYMKENHIKYFLSGGNFALESILSVENTHSAMDICNIKDIHKKYGEKPINRLTFLSLKKKLIYSKIYKIKTLMPLNYVEYNRSRAFAELNTFSDFQYYGSKHLENKLTAFIQLYWFTKKFHEDKRLAHYSSMIISNQMQREEAISLLQHPLYDETMMNDCIDEIKNRLCISNDEFNHIMESPTKKHSDFKMEENGLFLHILNAIKKH